MIKISELAVGDRIAVRWYPGQVPVIGMVVSVIRHASRASGSLMRCDSGQTIRIKASMKIERA